MSFKFPKGKMQSLGVGLLLQMACRDAGFEGADNHIAYGENGKPYLADFPEVHFNLSHSGERVMCVISPFEVGCDVEIIKGDRGKLAERFFKPEESAWIKHFETLEAQSEAFYRLWTLKECYMKVTGRGLSLMPDMFALHMDELENVTLFHEGKRPEYSFREIDLHDGYRYAYCILPLLPLPFPCLEVEHQIPRHVLLSELMMVRLLKTLIYWNMDILEKM